jgi:hypothetical protein
MIRGYAVRSGKPEEEIAALMAAETWFDAQDALAAGLATRIAEPVRIAASFDIGRFRNAPPALTELIDAEGAATGDDIVPDANDVVPATTDPLPQPQTEQTDAAGSNIPSTVAPASAVAAAITAPDATAIRAEAIAHARAVIDLCRLSGQPQMAGRFLEQDTTLDAVRAKLLATKAEADPDISAHHPQPGPGPSARPWGDVIARTFKSKG